jgi:hypothetical protein
MTDVRRLEMLQNSVACCLMVGEGNNGIFTQGCEPPRFAIPDQQWPVGDLVDGVWQQEAPTRPLPSSSYEGEENKKKLQEQNQTLD